MGAWNDEGQASRDILRLVLVLAETTEEEDVGVLGRRRAGSRWGLWVAEEVDEPNHAREGEREGDGHWVAWLHVKDGMQSTVRRPQRRVLWDSLPRHTESNAKVMTFRNPYASRCSSWKLCRLPCSTWRRSDPKREHLENHLLNNWVQYQESTRSSRTSRSKTRWVLSHFCKQSKKKTNNKSVYHVFVLGFILDVHLPKTHAVATL